MVLVPPARLEHAAYGLGIRRSIHLSYGGLNCFGLLIDLSDSVKLDGFPVVVFLPDCKIFFTAASGCGCVFSLLCFVAFVRRFGEFIKSEIESLTKLSGRV